MQSAAPSRASSKSRSQGLFPFLSSVKPTLVRRSEEERSRRESLREERRRRRGELNCMKAEMREEENRWSCRQDLTAASIGTSLLFLRHPMRLQSQGKAKFSSCLASLTIGLPPASRQISKCPPSSRYNSDSWLDEHTAKSTTSDPTANICVNSLLRQLQWTIEFPFSPSINPNILLAPAASILRKTPRLFSDLTCQIRGSLQKQILFPLFTASSFSSSYQARDTEMMAALRLEATFWSMPASQRAMIPPLSALIINWLVLCMNELMNTTVL